MFRFTGQVERSRAHHSSHRPQPPCHGDGNDRPVVRFSALRAADIRRMDLKRPVLVLALAGSLVACGGDNTNLDRGETNCDASGQEASNDQDAECEEEGPEED